MLDCRHRLKLEIMMVLLKQFQYERTPRESGALKEDTNSSDRLSVQRESISECSEKPVAGEDYEEALSADSRAERGELVQGSMIDEIQFYRAQNTELPAYV